LFIAREHLVSRQLENNGIDRTQAEFTDEGIKHIISHYTREAGVRNLEREIGSVCRKVAKKVVLKEAKSLKITPDVVVDLLGAPRFLREDRLKEDSIGIVTGLAWT